MTPNARRLDRPALYPDGSPFQTLHSAVYHLFPPLSVEDYDGVTSSVEYVVVSTTLTSVGSTTMAFPATPEGAVDSWTEIHGLHECDSHERLLMLMGYPYVIAAQQRAIEEGGPGSDSYMSFL